MTSRLNGKVCFITAAGQGIGRAIAERFVAEGATVWSTDLDASKLIGLDPATARALDVCSTEAIDTLAREIGGIDVLVNAAGYVHHGSVLDCAEVDWDLSFDVNAKSMHRTVRAFLPGMLERGDGSIINVASAVSSIRGAPNRYVYGASKAAVIGLTKAIAADFIRAGIRANVICPGTIDSPSLEARIAAQAVATNRSVAEIRQVFVDRQPLGRLGSAEEIAALAVYLASDESKYTTGAIHIIDGGFSL
ncbi:MAG: oxidoreductase [Microvirga sp.]|jgi:2-keto-3-deoxy-L-fuconate dehydrogenase|nr:oxidoreductase [Microvirga sp.]